MAPDTCQGTSHAGYHVDCMQNQGGQNITIRNSTGSNGVQVYGNVFPVAVSCSNVAFDHNVFAASGGSTCGTAAKRCTPAWFSTPPTNSGGGMPNAQVLTSDSCVRAAGNPARYPATDIDNQARHQGATTPDAGPDEVG